MVVGEQVYARQVGEPKGDRKGPHALPATSGAKGRPQGSPPLHTTSPALTMSGEGSPTHSACDCITRMERELHLSALNLFFLTCIRCTCWDLMGRFFVQDMHASLTHVLDNELLSLIKSYLSVCGKVS